MSDLSMIKKLFMFALVGGMFSLTACAAGGSSTESTPTESTSENTTAAQSTAETTTPVNTEAQEVTTTQFTYTTEEWKAPEEYGKVIALTFDDGPNTTTTNEVLDVLEEFDVKASFFVIGTNISEETVPIMQRAVSQGCEINSHSMTHDYMNSMTEEEILADTEQVNQLIKDAIGTEPKFFRPPYIATSGKMFRLIEMPFIAGYGCDDWDPAVDVDTRVQKTLEQSRDGAIILLHDAKGNSQTVEALRQIIPALQEQGYEFVTVSELFYAKGIQYVPGLKKTFSAVPQ